MALLQRRVVAYQLQDVRCTSCKLVAADVMRATCRACSKPLELQMDTSRFRASLGVFRNVAKHHKLNWLSDEVESLEN